MRETVGGDPRASKGGSRARWVFGIFAVFAALLLALEHRVHVLGLLPWLILLACPLMHLFMHHGHRHGARGEGERQ